MPLDSWSAFLSWKVPAGKRPSDIKKYYLTGYVNDYVNSTGDYLFYFIDKNVVPGQHISVSITAEYTTGNGTYLTQLATTPQPGKFYLFL